MDSNTASEAVISLLGLTDVITIILAIVALIVTIIGFFAALKFYRDGSSLQKLANDALVKIEERTNLIQTQVTGVFEKTLDAAISRSAQISTDFDEINSQIQKASEEIVNSASAQIQKAGKIEEGRLKQLVDERLKEVQERVQSTRTNVESAVSETSGLSERNRRFSKSVLKSLYHTLEAKNKVYDFLLKAKDWVPVDQISQKTGVDDHLLIYEVVDALLSQGQIEKKTEKGLNHYRAAI